MQYVSRIQFPQKDHRNVMLATHLYYCRGKERVELYFLSPMHLHEGVHNVENWQV
jgi:hypothetical protein